MDSATPGTDRGSTGRLSVPDRALYALFARHADAGRHRTDRRRYRGTDLRTSFDVFLARAYGLSWLVPSLAGPESGYDDTGLAGSSIGALRAVQR